MKKYSIGVLLGLGIITTLLLLAANRTPLESPPKHRANRLIHEKSPYLLQHAYNPVNWYPWGDEAFTQARKEKKVIFLSIGYSTCYWCHVMEREIFENEELAALLNASFISIKVDREERPDVDRVYMAALQAMTGSGGWPMSLFVTPNLKPFFGATYIPPDRFGVLLKRIQEIWTTDPDQVKQSSQRLIEFLKKQAVVTPSTAPLEKSSLTKAFETLKRGYDETYAGFGSGPKFPRPVTFNFLLRYYKRFGDRKALDMTLETLKRMAEGGIYDHLGGGFHRYSVDGQWRVPHFEKMLYDQAQLVESYLDAYQITHELYYANIARETLAYVLRRMTDPQGGFYSAEDAESALDPEKPKEKEEGAFYVWTQEQIDGVLEKRQSEIFDYAYGVQPSGNALSDPQKVFVKKNILYRNHTIEEIAKRFNITEREATTSLRDSRARLFERREKRPQPHLDDKILVSWNGLMISAFARAYQVLDDPTYLSAAVKSADFILEKLYQPATKQLLRRYRDGEARFPAHLKDYAFFVMGLLDLYEADFDIRWLQMGRELTERQNRLLFDEKVGGFFDSSSEDRSLLFRTKEDYDGAEPSGNAIAISNLLRIAEMTNNRQFRTMADQTLSLFGERLANRPQAMPQMLVAMDFHLDKPKQIMIAGRRGQKDTKRMLKEIHKRYIPNKIVLLADGDRGQEFLSRNIPFIQSVKMIGNLATAYICENYSCKLPTPDLTAMGRLLDEER